MTRRPRLALVLLLLVALPLAAGFLLSDTEVSKALVIDLRQQVDNDALQKQLSRNRAENGFPVFAISTPAGADADLCNAPKPPIYCQLRKARDTIVVASDDYGLSSGELLRRVYGPDVEIEAGSPVTTGTTSTSKGFNGSAAFLAALLVVAGAFIYRTRLFGVLRRQRAPQPATQPATTLAPTPWATVPAQTTRPAEHRRQAQSQVRQMVGRPIVPMSAAELQQLVADSGGNATARTHIGQHGGYVEVGSVVVWAVLRAPARSVAVPDDPLTVVGVDERGEALIVAPAGRAPEGGRP